MEDTGQCKFIQHLADYAAAIPRHNCLHMLTSEAEILTFFIESRQA